MISGAGAVGASAVTGIASVMDIGPDDGLVGSVDDGDLFPVILSSLIINIGQCRACIEGVFPNGGHGLRYIYVLQARASFERSETAGLHLPAEFSFRIRADDADPAVELHFLQRSASVESATIDVFHASRDGDLVKGVIKAGGKEGIPWQVVLSK